MLGCMMQARAVNKVHQGVRSPTGHCSIEASSVVWCHGAGPVDRDRQRMCR